MGREEATGKLWEGAAGAEGAAGGGGGGCGARGGREEERREESGRALLETTMVGTSERRSG